MLKALKWITVAAAVAAVLAFVPVGGRTVLERWRAAKNPAAFAESGWSEIRRGAARLLHGAPGRRAHGAGPGRPAAHGPARQKPPVESHTEADRDALDSIVADRAQ